MLVKEGGDRTSDDFEAGFDTVVPDYPQRDDVHGVQGLVFEVEESDGTAGNETNETGNESAVTVAV